MLKRSKIVAFLAAAVTGSLLGGGCGFGGFGSGLLGGGFVDNVWLDVVTDWLNEDLFG